MTKTWSFELFWPRKSDSGRFWQFWFLPFTWKWFTRKRQDDPTLTIARGPFQLRRYR